MNGLLGFLRVVGRDDMADAISNASSERLTIGTDAKNSGDPIPEDQTPPTEPGDNTA